MITGKDMVFRFSSIEPRQSSSWFDHKLSAPKKRGYERMVIPPAPKANVVPRYPRFLFESTMVLSFVIKGREGKTMKVRPWRMKRSSV